MIDHKFRMGERVTKVSIILPRSKSLSELPCHISITTDLEVGKSSKTKFTVNSVEYSQKPQSQFQKCLMSYQRSAFARTEDELSHIINLAKGIIRLDLEQQKRELEEKLANINHDLGAMDGKLVISKK